MLQVTQHYSKPGVTAVEVLPVFPDFEVCLSVHRVSTN